MTFPRNFKWGAAAAAFQIEGAANQDGKGLSVWDVFSKTDGRIWQGNLADVACDHYNLYKQDVKIMAEMRLKAYRLSVSWPRVLPEGTGKVNEKGLGFYDRLIDELLANNIEPYVTLFHWDFPYELYCKGGWLNRDVSDWFAQYAAVLTEKLSDRVTNWITLNEPQCFIGLGHVTAEHAPGVKFNLSQTLSATHNVLLSHGKAAQTIRANSKLKPSIGYASIAAACYPAAENKSAIDAARKATFAVSGDNITWCNSWWLDPVIFGTYPQEALNAFGSNAPKILAGDMETIAQGMDFIGMNLYTGTAVSVEKDGSAKHHRDYKNLGITSFGWPVTPQAIYWCAKFFHEHYNVPIIITENGMANNDWVNLDGRVHDPQRIDFLRRYLLEIERAIADGVDIRGYFAWSILDNFEWAEGYSKRFGLVYVDYETQKRILKDSALWYKQIIETNGAKLNEDVYNY